MQVDILSEIEKLLLTSSMDESRQKHWIEIFQKGEISKELFNNFLAEINQEIADEEAKINADEEEINRMQIQIDQYEKENLPTLKAEAREIMAKMDRVAKNYKEDVIKTESEIYDKAQNQAKHIDQEKADEIRKKLGL
jgi:hypothetical protein